MDAKPLDEEYFRWLYSLVADPTVRDKSMSYWKLLRQLFTTQFVWLIPNDDNRLEDGKALREEFLHVADISHVDRNWIDLDCSVLELVVGLARRLEFEGGRVSHYWFWKLMENIGVIECNDQGLYPQGHVEDILNDIIFRQYDRHGNGGFFPLRHPCQDQRRVELWYQLNAYVLENT